MKQQNWGWLMTLGIIFFIAGIFMLASPLFVAMALELFIGWFLVISGVVATFHAFEHRDLGAFMFRLLSGLLALVCGILMLTHILMATLALSLFLAFYLLGTGVFKIIAALQMRQYQVWGWLLFSGILALILGIILIATPMAAAWILGVFVGVDAIFYGWWLIMLSLAVKKFQTAG